VRGGKTAGGEGRKKEMVGKISGKSKGQALAEDTLETRTAPEVHFVV
jgi:hypothetical protein